MADAVGGDGPGGGAGFDAGEDFVPGGRVGVGGHCGQGAAEEPAGAGARPAEEADDIAAAGLGIGGGGRGFGHPLGEGVGFAHYAGQGAGDDAPVRHFVQGDLEAAAGAAGLDEQVPVVADGGGGVADGAGEGFGGAVEVAFGGVADGEVEVEAGAVDVVGRGHFGVPSPLIGGWIRVRGGRVQGADGGCRQVRFRLAPE